MKTKAQPLHRKTARHESPTLKVLPPPIPKKTRRNGKIARLPKVQRDAVCRMLQDAVPYENIVDFLEDLGVEVTERNISNWKTRGGYEEWRLDQKHILSLRLQQDLLTDHLRDDPNELPEAGLQLAATRYSQLLLRPDLQDEIQTRPEKFLNVINALCKINREILSLQKFRDKRRFPGSPGYPQEKAKAKDFVEKDETRQIFSFHPFPKDVGPDELPIEPPKTWLPS
jgi:hypothetical protein